ncbi:MAG: SdpI family protein [Flavobacteriaceae bacterium]|nr:SdpI family protein [Flavobacteriaceae bacterium]
MSDLTNLYLALGYCIFMLILGLILQKFPPKKINHIYGYRTNRSMQNENTWNTANQYSSRLMVRMSLLSLIFPPLLYFIYPEYNFMITIVVNTLLIVSILWFTENHLKSKFDTQGNRIES